jgi:hypothetical protein
MIYTILLHVIETERVSKLVGTLHTDFEAKREKEGTK